MNTELTAPRRRRWRWLRRLVVAVFTLAVLVPAVFYLLERSARSRWDRLAADIRAKGQPLTYAEIAAARPELADEDNGAIVVAEAIRRLGEITEPDDSGVLLLDHECAHDYFDGIDRACLPATRAYLESRRPALSVLSDLSEYEKSRLTVPFDMSPMDRSGELLKVLSPNRQIGKLLYLDAMTHIIDGDTAAAVDRIILSLRTTESLYAEPALISELVAIASDSLTASSIEGLLLAHELTGDDLLRLEREWTRHLLRRTMRPAMLGERAFIVFYSDSDRLRGEMAKHADDARPATDSNWDSSGAWKQFPFVTEWLMVENRMNVVAAITRVIDTSNETERLLGIVQNELNVIPKWDPCAQTLRILFPSIARSVDLYARGLAQVRCASVALAAERFRLAHGKLPDAAAEFVPDYLDEVPVDPFDGEPLRYRRTDARLVIYTIGDDEIDDGGDVAPQSAKEGDRARDFGIRLHGPDKRGLRFINAP